MAAVSAQKMSDGKLAAATGRVRADWHAVLDAAGAREWEHPKIAAWLQSEHGVEGWWAQGITVGYEQAIGRRLPGQTADGTFAVSATKSIDGSRAENLDAILETLTAHWGSPASVTPASLYSTARWKIAGETVVAAVSEPKSGKTSISLTRSRIADGDALDRLKEELRQVLDAIAVAGDHR
ncbi:MAG: hypothetical protein J0H56_12695 [Micrococcales bacterium]|nr:hypothetical protein [Micrococcales bacterium]